MTGSTEGAPRNRGEIETLRGGSLRVKVYAGIDPVTKKKHYRTETIKPGPSANKLAEKARTRFLAQVDERRPGQPDRDDGISKVDEATKLL
jgi:hypothetical protein